MLYPHTTSKPNRVFPDESASALTTSNICGKGLTLSFLFACWLLLFFFLFYFNWNIFCLLDGQILPLKKQTDAMSQNFLNNCNIVQKICNSIVHSMLKHKPPFRLNSNWSCIRGQWTHLHPTRQGPNLSSTMNDPRQDERRNGELSCLVSAEACAKN